MFHSLPIWLLLLFHLLLLLFPIHMLYVVIISSTHILFSICYTRIDKSQARELSAFSIRDNNKIWTKPNKIAHAHSIHTRLFFSRLYVMFWMLHSYAVWNINSVYTMKRISSQNLIQSKTLKRTKHYRRQINSSIEKCWENRCGCCCFFLLQEYLLPKWKTLVVCVRICETFKFCFVSFHLMRM